jgi:hypothetical protein
MTGMRTRALALASASWLAACGSASSEPAEPYDLPVKTSGGIDEEPPAHSAPLTVAVEIEDPDVAAELAGEVESAIAFDHYADLKGCESTIQGWEVTFAVGTVVIAFTLDTTGHTSDVEISLTTGDPPAALTACLVSVVEQMQLAVAPGEQPTTVHLLLKYGQ